VHIYFLLQKNEECTKSGEGWRGFRCEVIAPKLELIKEDVIESKPKKQPTFSSFDDDNWGMDDSWTISEETDKISDLELQIKMVNVTLESPATNTSKLEVDGVANKKTNHPAHQNNTFAAYYLDVEDEPPNPKKSDDHAGMFEDDEMFLDDENEVSGEQWNEKYEPEADKTFSKFQKRFNRSPKQVLRYSFNGKPLWISDYTPKSIPPCSECGSKRVFELQLMSSLIYLHGLSLNNQPTGIDFGSVVFYSCERSCHSSSDRNYHQEHIFFRTCIVSCRF